MFGVPHASFATDFPPSSGGLPPERRLARGLRQACTSAGAICSRIELWRGLGWIFSGEIRGREFEVYFSRYPNGRTLLAVAPLGANGFLTRVFGPDRAARESEYLHSVCEAIHSYLAAHRDVAELRWMVGGLPARSRQFLTPTQFPWPTTA